MCIRDRANAIKNFHFDYVTTSLIVIKGTFCLSCWDCQKAFKKVKGLSFLSQLILDRSQFWKLGTGRVSYGPFLSRPLSCHSTFVLHLHTRCCWNWYSSTRLLEVYSPSKVWVVAIFSVGPDVSPSRASFIAITGAMVPPVESDRYFHTAKT